jgi:hypothetical protein
MAFSGFFIGKTSVGEAQLCASFVGIEFNGDNGFNAFGSSREPGQFDKAIAFDAKEPSVVGMALIFEVGLEEEGGVDFGFHQDGACLKKALILFVKALEDNVEGLARGVVLFRELVSDDRQRAARSIWNWLRNVTCFASERSKSHQEASLGWRRDLPVSISTK